MGIGAGVGAAIGGVASAAGGLASGALSSGAAGSAAKAQQFASQLAVIAQSQQYQNTAGLLAPFTGAGSLAAGDLAGILQNGGKNLGQFGLPATLGYQTPGNLASILANPQFQPTEAQLEATPGYKFDLTQGEQGVANSNAAQGKGISGDALKGAASFATGLAQNTYAQQAQIFNQNYSNALSANQQGQGIFQSNLQNLLGPLAGLASLGENAGAQTGNAGVQTGQGIASALQTGGAAQAAGLVGGANALSSGITGGTNSLGNSLVLSQILGNQNSLSGNLLNSSGSPATLQGLLGVGGDQYVP